VGHSIKLLTWGGTLVGLAFSVLIAAAGQSALAAVLTALLVFGTAYSWACSPRRLDVWRDRLRSYLLGKSYRELQFNVAGDMLICEGMGNFLYAWMSFLAGSEDLVFIKHYKQRKRRLGVIWVVQPSDLDILATEMRAAVHDYRIEHAGMLEA
jgi:hypothetical protein